MPVVCAFASQTMLLPRGRDLSWIYGKILSPSSANKAISPDFSGLEAPLQNPIGKVLVEATDWNPYDFGTFIRMQSHDQRGKLFETGRYGHELDLVFRDIASFALPDTASPNSMASSAMLTAVTSSSMEVLTKEKLGSLPLFPSLYAFLMLVSAIVRTYPIFAISDAQVLYQCAVLGGQ